MAEVIPEHSPYAYVFNNPINYNDPTGMMGVGFANEYVEDKKTGELIKVGNKGGDNTDYIYEGTIHRDDDGRITGATYTENDNGIAVSETRSSGLDTRYTQDSDPTPGERNIHGSTPLDIKAYAFLTNLFSGGTSSTLGFAAFKFADDLIIGGTPIVKNMIINGYKVSNHAWRKSGLGRGATKELVEATIKSGSHLLEKGTGKFAGNTIKVYIHNGVKVAVDETRKIIMSIRPTN